MPTQTTARTPLQSPIDRIIVIRENHDSFDLLEGLIDQTYRMFRDRPEVEEALRLGTFPYSHSLEVPV